MTAQQLDTASNQAIAQELATFDWHNPKVACKGARIELIVIGNASAALAAADEWAAKLAHGAALDSIGLSVMSDDHRWKIIIQFKEGSHVKK